MNPLPFRLRVPGQDVIDSEGVWSISYRGEGLLHLEGGTLTLEWTATRTTERVSVKGIGTDVERSPIGTLEVPADLIISVRLRGGWWWPRLELRARRLDAFDDFPGSRPGVVTLKIRRRDREQAGVFVAAIDHARAVTPLPEGHDEPRLEPGD
jgi:hypothetical protein